MLQHISIRLRLLLFSCAFALGMLLLGGLGWYAGRHALAGMEQMYTCDMRALELLGEIKASMLDTAANGGLLLNSGSAAEKAAIVAQGEANLARAHGNWRAYRAIPAGAATAALSARFEPAFARAHDLVTRNLRASARGDLAQLASINQQIAPVWDVYVDLSGQLAEAQKQQSQRRYQDSVVFFGRFVGVVGATLAIGLLAAALLYWNFIRTVVRPLDGAVGDCERIAAGDLGAAPRAAPGRNEIGRLLGAFALMRANLGRTVGAIQQSTAEIDVATRAVAELAALVTRIAAASRAQGGAIRELGAAVVGQATAAAQSLSAQSDALLRAIAVFRVVKGTDHAYLLSNGRDR